MTTRTHLNGSTPRGPSTLHEVHPIETQPAASPHVLVDIWADAARAAGIGRASQRCVSWDLTRRQLCDFELLANGAYSPLTGFMTRRDYESVLTRMRTADGALWPVPVTLDVPEGVASKLSSGDMLALRDPEGVMLGALSVEDVWLCEAEVDVTEQGFSERAHPWCVGGRLEVLQWPTRHAFRGLWRTPAQLRETFTARGWTRVLAVQPDGPMHKAERDLTLRAARDSDAALLIQPAVGMAAPDDPEFYVRIRCYEKVLESFPPGVADLSLLPLATRVHGSRETLRHAIVRRNHGCTHFLAAPPSGEQGDLSDVVQQFGDELGIALVPSRSMVFVPRVDGYVPADQVSPGHSTLALSAADLQATFARGGEVPEWFSFPAVIDELRRIYPPRSLQGFTVFFTGLSGSGKSTIANALLVRLMERARRAVTLLDGDIVRKHLSSELGFSKEHRDIHIRRIGYVASEITKAGAIAICCPIAPYQEVRQEVRAMIAPHGGFVLVHVATPLEVCEQRDRKGLYAKARAGVIHQFTGISDPYEIPSDADMSIDTTCITPEDAVDRIMKYLREQGYLVDAIETAASRPIGT